MGTLCPALERLRWGAASGGSDAEERGLGRERTRDAKDETGPHLPRGGAAGEGGTEDLCAKLRTMVYVYVVVVVRELIA